MKPGKRGKAYGSFVALERSMLRSDAWQKDLTNAEKVLYIHIKFKYVGSNNGEIVLHYSELKNLMAPATASRAFKGLLDKGWIEKTRQGGLYRYQNLYRLTGKYDQALRSFKN